MPIIRSPPVGGKDSGAGLRSPTSAARPIESCLRRSTTRSSVARIQRQIDGSGIVPRDDANAAGFADVSASEADQAAPNVIPTHPNIAGITLRPGVRYRRIPRDRTSDAVVRFADVSEEGA